MGTLPNLHTVRKWALFRLGIRFRDTSEWDFGQWILQNGEKESGQVRQGRTLRVDGIHSLSCPIEIPSEFRSTLPYRQQEKGSVYVAKVGLP